MPLPVRGRQPAEELLLVADRIGDGLCLERPDEQARGVAARVLRLEEIVAAVVGPLTLAKFTMNVFGALYTLGFSHDGDIAANELVTKRRRLSHETLDYLCMVLGENGRHNIPFG